MCLYPKLILNKKYLPNKKNDYKPPKLHDIRLKYVPVACGNCYECRKQKANEWRTRLNCEFTQHKYTYFVTLTINNDTFERIIHEKNITSANAIATILTRRFLERWRKVHKKSLTHWFITELGEENNRLHLHGFIFSEENITNKITTFWKYGNTYIGEYCNERTINYCVKYCTKIDEKHKDYKFIILCSKGIGANYWKQNQLRHQLNGENTIEYYTLPNGNKCALPIYYRNHFWNDEEREKLWLQKIEEKTIYINGIKCDISTEKGIQQYLQILQQQQIKNIENGFGDDSKDWKKKDYNITLKTINAKSKLQKARKNGKNIT